MLVVTSLEDLTADMVISVLNGRRIPVVRVDPGDLGWGLTLSARIGVPGASIWSGPLNTVTRAVDLAAARAVYWRRPSPWRYAKGLLPREAAFAAAEATHGLIGVLASLPVRYVSHPERVRAADFKPAQLRAAAELGFTVPPTLITNMPEDAKAFIKTYGPVVYKAFRGVATGGGAAGAIWTQRVSADEVDDSVGGCPHLFKAEVKKGADVRVTAVGTRIFASTVHTPERLLDWRAGDWDTLVYEPCEVPGDVRAAMLGYLDRCGLEFGCFDFVIDSGGRWNWLECNPNGQWGFLPEAPAIADAIADLLQEG